jgi:hypothetical protein
VLYASQQMLKNGAIKCLRTVISAGGIVNRYDVQ